MSDNLHVYPLGDLVAHDTSSEDCICGPTVESTDGGWVIIHHALDGREHSEHNHDRQNCPLCSSDAE